MFSNSVSPITLKPADAFAFPSPYHAAAQPPPPLGPLAAAALGTASPTTHLSSSSSRASPGPVASPCGAFDGPESTPALPRIGSLDAFPISPSSSSADLSVAHRRERARSLDCAVSAASGLIHFSVGHRRSGTLCGTLDVTPQPRTLLCMRGVPSYLTPADLCGEKLAAFLGSIRHIRVVWGDSDSLYHLLVLCTSVPEAVVFHDYFHGKPLSALGPDVVCVQYVQALSVGHRFCVPTGSITFHDDVVELGDCPICMEKCCDAEVCRHVPSCDGGHLHLDARQGSDHSGPGDTSREANLSSPGSEPTVLEASGGHGCCPANLGAIFTTLCNHTFHSKCLSQWGDSCPVCRYNQQDSSSCCYECKFDSAADLWLCITCGNIGCGRYTEGKHAIAHYRQTHHTYSMNLETRQVWDYAGDGLVHRLLFRTDGKVVEMPDPHSTSKARDTGEDPGDLMDAKFESKVESVCQFYTNLLESQLKEQTVYFECKIAENEAEFTMQLEDLQSQIACSNKAIERMQREAALLAQEGRKLAAKEAQAQRRLAEHAEELALQQRIHDSTTEEVRKCRQTLEALSARAGAAPQAAQAAELEARVSALRLRLTETAGPPSSSSAADPPPATATAAAP